MINHQLVLDNLIIEINNMNLLYSKYKHQSKRLIYPLSIYSFNH